MKKNAHTYLQHLIVGKQFWRKEVNEICYMQISCTSFVHRFNFSNQLLNVYDLYIND
jgi:hypothetical protein